MATTVVVIGGANLRRTLKQASRDIKQLKAVNAAAAGIVAAAAKAAAPKKSGRLAGSVKVGSVSNRSGRIEYGRGVPYAGPIHWGWPARRIKAQPFVSEAAQATESQWIELYKQHVDNVINNVKGA